MLYEDTCGFAHTENNRERERQRCKRFLSDPAWCDTQLGTMPEFSFPVKDHLELGEALGMVDFERAAEVSGSKFYYLKGMGAMLELALVNWAMQKVRFVAAAAAAQLSPLRSQPSGNARIWSRAWSPKGGCRAQGHSPVRVAM